MNDCFDENDFDDSKDYFDENEEHEYITPELVNNVFFSSLSIPKLWIALYDNWIAKETGIESVLFLINHVNYGDYLVLDEYIKQKNPNMETDIIMRDVVKVGLFDILGYNFNKNTNKSRNIKNND